jgi:hypothetical protein
MIDTTLTAWTPGLGMSVFDNASNYMGERISGFYVYAQNRDSDALTRSNFTRILEDLNAAAEAAGSPDCVLTPSFGHWACGHVDQLCLSAEAPESVIRKAEEILQDLEDYPVYDEDHFSCLEYEESSAFWDGLSPREKVRMAEYERDRCHWLKSRPVWVYGRLDWCELCDRAGNGDTIAIYLEEGCRQS